MVRDQEKLARLERPTRTRPTGPVAREVRAGERYWAEALGREVEVIREPDAAGRVLVLQGGLRVELSRSDLRVLPDPAPTAPRPVTRPPVSVPQAEDATGEIHLRGCRVEEALARLDDALDRALLAGLPELRVIHGKGTGVLREAVWEFCRNHPAVRGVRNAEAFEGGGGATVVRLEG